MKTEYLQKPSKNGIISLVEGVKIWVSGYLI